MVNIESTPRMSAASLLLAACASFCFGLFACSPRCQVSRNPSRKERLCTDLRHGVGTRRSSGCRCSHQDPASLGQKGQVGAGV